MTGEGVGPGPYTPLKIEVAIKFHQLMEGSFFILKPNGEFVKITHEAKSLLKTLKGYQDRGLKEIYLEDEIYQILVLKLQEYLSKKESLKTSFEDLKLLYKNLRHQLLTIGINGIAIRQAEEINRNIIAGISSSPDLASIISEYKDNCPEEFFRYLMICFLTTAMIDTFPWKSQQIKIKVGMACMMCDVALRPEDYLTMQKQPSPSSWDAELYEHPLLSAKLVMQADPMVPSEVIQMIEMHHELQDANGYPRGVGFANIPLLPSILIVAQNFVEGMEKHDFSKDYIDEILGDVYRQFTKGSFKQASMAIFNAVGHQLP